MEQDDILAVLYTIDKKGDFGLQYIISLNEYEKVKHQFEHQNDLFDLPIPITNNADINQFTQEDYKMQESLNQALVDSFELILLGLNP